MLRGKENENHKMLNKTTTDSEKVGKHRNKEQGQQIENNQEYGR